MAIKIHHGPNGSYKTSGAIWDDAVPAAKEGRLIITNVRGVTDERFHSVFPDLPDSFDVMYINHETQEGMDRIRTWFQWAPRNAFLIFDEAQTLFPKKWSDKFLEQYDYPGGMDSAKAADKPMNFLDAWTRHRHWNWDVVLTTPNIKYVHDDIRQTSEAAYQHSNLMLLGKWLKFLSAKDYKEAMHSAQENRAPTDGSNIVALRKIDKRVFKLYDSTATGLHRDTMAGKNAFASPRVVILVGVLVVVFGALYWRHGSSVFSNPLAIKGATVAAPAAKAAGPEYYQSDSRFVDHGVSDKPAVPVATGITPQDPFALYDITIKGSIWNEAKGVIFVFNLAKDQRSFNQSSHDMIAAGYSIRARGYCAAELTFNGVSRTVACLGSLPDGGGEERLGAERRVAAGGSSSSFIPGASQRGDRQMPAARGASFTVVPDSSRTPRTLQ